MTKMITTTLKLKIWKDIHGQDLAEYALMAGFLAAATVFTLPTIAADVAVALTKVVAILGGTTDTSPA